MILSAPLATNHTSRKRCREEEEESSLSSSPLSTNKNIKLMMTTKSQLFHRQRMEHRLEWASRCALDGNHRMMEFYLAQAKKDAFQCGLLSLFGEGTDSDENGSFFTSWANHIRGQLIMYTSNST